MINVRLLEPFEQKLDDASPEACSRFALDTLMALPNVKDTQTSFSLKEVKASSTLPIKLPSAR